MSIKETSLRLLQTMRRVLGFGAVSLILLAASAGVGSAQPDSFPLKADDIAPLTNPTPQQAADIQSIINVHTAYANNLDSSNVEGVLSLMLPTNGYTFQKDTPTMEPSGCAPQPQADTPCITQGGCFSMGYSSTQLFLKNYGLPTNKPIPVGLRHSLGNFSVTFGDGGHSATLYTYWTHGRYILDFWKTQDGWRIKWHRIVWNSSSTYHCPVDWSQKSHVLATDLYLMELATAGPQLPVALMNNPSIKRVNTYLNMMLEQVNLGAYPKACALANEMTKAVGGDAGLDAGHKEYFDALSYRFLQDGACDGQMAPDRTHSNGGWAAAAAWRGYELSGTKGVPRPQQIPAWSVELIHSNT
jgi:hypothetical protein